MISEKKLLSLDSTLIPSGWFIANLESCLEKIIDYRGKTPEKSDYGILTLSAKSVKMAEIDYSKAYFVSKETYDKFMVRGFPKKGDILLTTEAPLGCVAKLDRNDICIAQRLITLRGKEGILDNEYMRFFLSSPIGQAELLNRASGSTVQGIKRTEFSKVNILLPPSIKEQKKIANILSSLEDKITLNRQINQTLEAMAQALFKSWFVDFEPVKAKLSALAVGGSADDANLAAMSAISGKTTEQLLTLKTTHPDQFQQLVITADLFPSEMVECELGEIPKGWEVKAFGDEFDVTMGQSPPGESYNEIGEGVAFFQGRTDFGDRYPTNRVYTTQPNRMANAGDTLLSVRAPVGDINKAETNCCIGRGLSAIRHKSGCEAYTYYALWNLSAHFDSFDKEGTVFGSINQKDLKALKLVFSSAEVRDAFSKTAMSFDERISINSQQITTLQNLRDSLLPKLLSGELLVDGVGDEA